MFTHSLNIKKDKVELVINENKFITKDTVKNLDLIKDSSLRYSQHASLVVDRTYRNIKLIYRYKSPFFKQ